jgi:hypothetical protein
MASHTRRNVLHQETLYHPPPNEENTRSTKFPTTTMTSNSPNPLPPAKKEPRWATSTTPIIPPTSPPKRPFTAPVQPHPNPHRDPTTVPKSCPHHRNRNPNNQPSLTTYNVTTPHPKPPQNRPPNHHHKNPSPTVLTARINKSVVSPSWKRRPKIPS